MKSITGKNFEVNSNNVQKLRQKVVNKLKEIANHNEMCAKRMVAYFNGGIVDSISLENIYADLLAKKMVGDLWWFLCILIFEANFQTIPHCLIEITAPYFREFNCVKWTDIHGVVSDMESELRSIFNEENSSKFFPTRAFSDLDQVKVLHTWVTT